MLGARQSQPPPSSTSQGFTGGQRGQFRRGGALEPSGEMRIEEERDVSPEEEMRLSTRRDPPGSMYIVEEEDNRSRR
jgi:hypothetical protein